MRGKNIYLLVLVFSLTVFHSKADESFTFKQIGTQDGLSQSTVRSILVDRKGFVWAGTLDGLNRYDGSGFITYKPEFGEGIKLTDHRIRSIFEDKNGYIWIRKYDNTYSCYNPQTESFVEVMTGKDAVPLNFTNYMETADSSVWLWEPRNGCVKIRKQGKELQAVFYALPSSEMLEGSGVEMVFQDSRHHTWIGGPSGLCLVSDDQPADKFYSDEEVHYFRKAIEVRDIVYFITDQDYIFRYDLWLGKFLPPLRAPKHYRFIDIAKLDDNRLLFCSRNEGLMVMDISAGTFKTNPFPGMRISESAQILTDSKGGVWIFDHSGILRRYVPETGNLTELRLISPQITSVIDYERYNVFIDSRNIYWITTYGNGLYRYEPHSGKLENYRRNDENNSLASDYLLSITEDGFGNLWIGSEYAGIIKVVKQKFNVKYIHPEKANLPGTSNNVKVIFEDSRENVWVGTKNGSLYLFDKRLAKYRRIHQNMNPYTIIEDDQNRIWIGTKGNGIYVYSLSGEHEIMHFVNDAGNANSLNHNSIFNILQDKQHRIWIASFGGGLDLLVNSGGRYSFKHFFSDEGNKSYIRYLYEDNTGNIWAGSYEGLIFFNPDEFISDPQKYRQYSYDNGNPEGLNCNDIKTIYQDKRKRFWIGTAGGGLNLLLKGRDSDSVHFIKFTTKQGLPSDIITAILEDCSGELWISTENGIARFDDQQKTFIVYHFAEHSGGNYYSENAGTLRRNGDMMWGTLDGLIVFNPGKFISNNNAPPVVLTDLFLFDQRVQPGQKDSPLAVTIGEAGNLVLNHNQNTFTLYFSNLDLTEPSRNKYSYKMEAFDQFWSIPGSNNSATYKNLPPGKYIFRIKGSDADGQWSDKETVLNITVNPPFWKSQPAKMIYLIITLFIIGTAILIIIKITRLNSMVRMEKQLTDYKLRFFTNISHEFRTPLTMIKASVESLKELEDITPKAKKYIELLTGNAKQMNMLIDQLLEFRKIQNNVLTLNLELTEVNSYVSNIFYNFKEIADRKKINFRMMLPEDAWSIYIDHNKVDKIIFNLLSNAFKFTPRYGLVELVVEKNTINDTCKISVKDNGIGIPKDKQNQLFSRFMQVHFSAEGTGVGLSLVKEFAETHRGKVWFEENAGGGSVFCLELPASTEVYKDARHIDGEIFKPVTLDTNTTHEISHDEAHISNLPSAQGWKILIIDDNKDIRDYLFEEFKSHFVAETAKDGNEGLEKAISGSPDLIICDVKMAGMDGIEVTTRIKNDFQTSHIPVILLTALSSESIQLAGSECGADAYIMKPFSMKFLLSRVYKLIEQREKLKKRFSIDINVKENILSSSDRDKEFYILVNEILDKHMNNPDFTVEEFTELSGQKRTIFYKKVKGLTGYSPNELIKIHRMKRAAELLLGGKHTVAEVSWKVGIEDQFYFSKCFKAQFGCSPSKYGNNNGHSGNTEESRIKTDYTI